ncbi:type VI secretion system protein TssA [Dyella tabacisoli]|nr:type VI secretion system protein TssA [Dyella tabacisoli]
MSLDLAELLAPISPDRPCGEDVSFNPVYDRVREARRADDPSLRQGEWQTELKAADWRQVIKLAGDVLATQSKDLQMAVWLGEALISTDGLAGAAQAFELLHRLLDERWEGLFPELDGDDAEERAAKLAWFNIYAGDALRKLPISSGVRSVTLMDWQDSREVDNLGRQSREAYQAALDEGRMTGEAFDKAMLESRADQVSAWLDQASAALSAFEPLKQMVDTRLGRAAPSLAALEDALMRLRQVIAKTAQAKGIAGAAAATESVAQTSSTTSTETALGMLDLSANTTTSKRKALLALSQIAEFFRRTEPHNPVSFMLDKAVIWANTPLDVWLSEVVRDDTVLSSIRDRVGIPG